jgi:hypothetical protein
MRYAIIVLSLFCSLSFAQVSAALDSIEENSVGFAVGGSAKGGMLSSTLYPKIDSKGEESFSEYLAFSDLLLSISVRPSNETKATFDLRFHKDWQSAYREGSNTPIIRWWSYDGNIMDKKLKFNLGTMRVAYTPLTIYLPEPNLIMEPEIFADLKKEAMEERYLDGTNRRLLHGINAEYKIPFGMFDNIFLQGTVVRLRKVADGRDRIFFDFDSNKDRFSTAARVGVETHGFSFGINDVYTFNRFSSAMLNKFSNPSVDSIVDYEKNNVLSFVLSYNSKKPSSVDFGVGAEYALSNWSHWQHKKVPADSVMVLDFATVDIIPSVVAPDGNINYYPYYRKVAPNYKPYKHELSVAEELKGKAALLGNAFVSYNENPFEIKLSGHFLKTNKDFEAELAASPAFLPNLPNLPILNGDAILESNLQQFRTSSLENMYYSLYYTLPLTIITIVNGLQGNPSGLCKGTNDRLYQATCLDNNYKLAHYYNNAYTQQTYTRLERGDSSVASRLDPAVNLALPYGYATPDRTGGDADLNFVWNKAVNVRGVFGMYSSEEANYTRFGGGAEVNAARLAGLSKALVISGSYEQSKEEKNIQTNRIMAGLKVGIWRGISLIGGFQQLSKEFENPYLGVDKINELLVIGGPQVKISERANFNLQGGLLSNSIEGSGIKYDLDKYIMSGMVRVDF